MERKAEILKEKGRPRGQGCMAGTPVLAPLPVNPPDAKSAAGPFRLFHLYSLVLAFFHLKKDF